MSELYFVDTAESVDWLCRQPRYDFSRTTLVCLTGSSLEAAVRNGIRALPVCDAASPVGVLRECQTDMTILAERIARNLDLHLATSLEGYIAGTLATATYQLFHAISSIMNRFILMRRVVEWLQPESICIVESKIVEYFATSEYSSNPWTYLLCGYAQSSGIGFEYKQHYTPENGKARIVNHKPSYRFDLNSFQQLSALLKESADTQRLLLLDSWRYDWKAVGEDLIKGGATSLFNLSASFDDMNAFHSYCYGAELLDCSSGKKFIFGNSIPPFYHNPSDALVSAVSEWVSRTAHEKTYRCNGIDLLAHLVPYLSSVCHCLNHIVPYTDFVADKVIRLIQPSALCLFSTVFPSTKRFIAHAKKHNVPVILYQHGGGWGSQRMAFHDSSDHSQSDFFLLYGPSLRLPSESLVPIKTKAVPAGSALIEAMTAKWGLCKKTHARTERIIKLLFIAEHSTENTYGGENTLEDTSRYLLEQRFMQEVALYANLKVVYRPLPGSEEHVGTCKFIQRSRFSNISIDTRTPLEELIDRADVLFSDTAHSTIWNEAIASDKPFVLFFDESSSDYYESFLSVLSKSCCWCKCVGDFFHQLHLLATNTDAFMQQERFRERKPFLESFVLGDNCKGAVKRVKQLLNVIEKRGNAKMPSDTEDVRTVQTPAGPLTFLCPNELCAWRAETLFTKEPETLEWISTFSLGDVLWDIGANVGLYSLFAAQRGTSVMAFEPSAFNYYILNRNIEANRLDDRILAFCIAFNDRVVMDHFCMQNTETGGAMNSFGEAIDFAGKKYQPSFSQGMLGYSIDGFIEQFQLPFPNHIKIDVDGIESKIIQGARVTLRDRRLRSILVELEDDRLAETNVVTTELQQAGFQLIAKRHAPMFDNGPYANCFNYIFLR